MGRLAGLGELDDKTPSHHLGGLGEVNVANSGISRVSRTKPRIPLKAGSGPLQVLVALEKAPNLVGGTGIEPVTPAV